MNQARARVLIVLLAVLGAGLIVYGVFFWDSDEDEIRERMDQLAASLEIKDSKANPVLEMARLKDDLDEVFTDDITVSIREGEATGKQQVVGLAAQLRTAFRTGSVAFSGVSIKIEANKKAADVEADATLTATDFGGRPRREMRHVLFDFVKVDGDWRIRKIEVGDPADM